MCRTPLQNKVELIMYLSIGFVKYLITLLNINARCLSIALGEEVTTIILHLLRTNSLSLPNSARNSKPLIMGIFKSRKIISGTWLNRSTFLRNSIALSGFISSLISLANEMSFKMVRLINKSTSLSSINSTFLKRGVGFTSGG